MKDKKRVADAYHVAGHLVACIILGLKFKTANLDEDEHYINLPKNFPDLGSVDITPKIKEMVELQTMKFLAGSQAENCFLSLSRHRLRNGDEGVSWDLIKRLCGDTDEMLPYILLLRARIRNKLTQEHNWKAVEEVAKKLLETGKLTYAETKNIYETAILESRKK